MRANPFEEHRRKQEARRRAEEEAAAAVNAAVVAEFGGAAASSSTKVFLRGGTFDPSRPPQQQQQKSSQQPVVYTLGREKEPSLAAAAAAAETLRKKRVRAIEELREEIGQTPASKMPFFRSAAAAPPTFGVSTADSTNLRVGNVAPTATESALLGLFARFGPVASVKIMWPATESERARGKNTGFVAFMDRKDAERALKAVSAEHIVLMGRELQVEWSKPVVPLPAHPLFLMGDRLCGLYGWPMSKDLLCRPLPQAPPPLPRIVVERPESRSQQRIIDRMAHLVLQHGRIAELLVMERVRERCDPAFAFLFDLDGAQGRYYRWRVFSLLQGDTDTNWRTESFQMFVDGPWWKPPPLPRSEDNGSSSEDNGFVVPRGQRRLGREEAAQFGEMLSKLTASNADICRAMGFALDNADAAFEVTTMIANALASPVSERDANSAGTLSSRIAWLFLVSDVLHNSSAAVHNAFAFRTHFYDALPGIFASLGRLHRMISGRVTAKHVQDHVCRVLGVWKSWALYATPFLESLEESFLGKPSTKDSDPEQKESEQQQQPQQQQQQQQKDSAQALPSPQQQHKQQLGSWTVVE